MTETVDLDAHLPAQLFALGAKISLHAQRENARDLGVDMCEWRTIQILGRDGASTINHVADRISMDRGGTSRAIARLDKRGIVQRSTTADDRRKSVIDLTDKGWTLHSRIADFANAREQRMMCKLSGRERRDLAYLLKKVTTEIDTMLADKWRPEGEEVLREAR